MMMIHRPSSTTKLLLLILRLTASCCCIAAAAAAGAGGTTASITNAALLPQQDNADYHRTSRSLEDAKYNYYEDVYSGTIAHAECHAFTMESDTQDEISDLLRWSHTNNLFHVAQQSYIFFQYDSGETYDDDTVDTTYQIRMVDLQTWMENMASIKGIYTPNCTRIDDPHSVLWPSRALSSYLSIDIDAYAAETGYYPQEYQQQDQQDQQQEHPSLYQGPICAMGRDANQRITTGIFLDSQCTVLAPKFMTDYHESLPQQQQQSDSGEEYYNITATMEETYEISVVAYQTSKSMSCKKYGICGSLLAQSVNTEYCDESDQRRRHRRRRYLQQEQDGENNNNNNNNQEKGEDEQGDDQMQDESSNGDDEDVETETVSYQLSQDDLSDMSSTCYAAVTLLGSGQSLESYLIENGQLDLEEPTTLMDWITLGLLIFVGIVVLFCCCRSFRCRRVKKKKNRTKKSGDDDTLNSDEDDYDDDDYDESLMGTIVTWVSCSTYGLQTCATGYTYDTGTYVSGTTAGTQTVDGWKDAQSKSPGTVRFGTKVSMEPSHRGRNNRPTTVTPQGIARSAGSWIQSLQLQRKRTKTPGDLRLPMVTPDDEGIVEFDMPSSSSQPAYDDDKDDNNTKKKRGIGTIFKKVKWNK
ncbi:hypothetical protein IV203_014119 [Nitzschia inconspicua]|uniref:Uncharacterized protein n=1 Tax=Nitzschia inconspicua TaxID=303405 RepID=A0A9K3K607_9STRA|nr:hypothetical protein IV203_014306 [Nitzschia inconspicua]KAG7375024.1 hypothetical protein IV203_014119 [Nitzschia inconspicua]